MKSFGGQKCHSVGRRRASLGFVPNDRATRQAGEIDAWGKWSPQRSSLGQIRNSRGGATEPEAHPCTGLLCACARARWQP